MRTRLLAALGGGILLLGTAPVLAAPPDQGFTVDSTGDAGDASPGDADCATADGDCTVRAAVEEANALGGVTKVGFATAGTITLGEQVTVSADVILRGDGSTLVGDGGNRLLDVTPGARLRVRQLTLTGGEAEGNGGLVRADQASVTILDSTLANGTVTGAGASGGAIAASESTLDVRRTTIADSSAVRAGGGIEVVGGRTFLQDVTLSGNDAGDAPGNGGGLHLTGTGTVTVRDSQVTGNSADEGGGLWVSATGTMSVIGTAVTGNTARGPEATTGGGGLFNDGGTLFVRDSAISGNTATVGSGSGGGIMTLGTTTVRSSAVTGNAAARAGGGVEASSEGITGSTRLVEVDLSDNTAGPTPGNGGGLHVSAPNDVLVSASVVQANTASAEGGGLWNNAGSTMRVVDTVVSGNVALGTEADNGGGGLFNNGGTMQVTGGSITGNTASEGSGSGGGILSLGDLTVRGTTIADNDAARAGGGIEATNTAVDATSVTTLLRDVTLEGNTAGPNPGNGGALHVTWANDVTVRDSAVVGNTASAEGGGLWNNAGSTMRVTGTDLQRNVALGTAADNGGGALFNNGGVLWVSDSQVQRNTATEGSGSGGGLLNDQGTAYVSDTTFTRNVSNRAGGGIEAVAGDTRLHDVRLTRNETGPAPGNGGGLHLSGDGLVVIDESTVERNVASNEGGGLWNSNTGTMTVTATRIVRNEAPIGPNVFQQPGGDGTASFTVDGQLVAPGDNDLSFR